MNLEEAKKKNVSCVYRLNFPNGKSYIGKTKDLSNRIRLYEQLIGSTEKETPVHKAIIEFGLNSVDVEILVQVSTSVEEDLDYALSILEIKYIRKMDTFAPNGYNVSIGGEIFSIPVEHFNTNYDGRKSVLVYDNEGNFLKEFESVARCAYNYNFDSDDVSLFLDKRKVFHGKYVFKTKKYGYIPERIDVGGFKVVERIKYKTEVVKNVIYRDAYSPMNKKTIMYDENGDFAGEFDSKSDALRTFSKRHSLPYGVYHNGYVLYQKESNDYPKKIEPYVETINKKLGKTYKPMSECDDLDSNETQKSYYTKKGWGKHKRLNNDFMIDQYSLNGELINVFDSIRDASDMTGIPYSGIWACVFGRTRKSNGYIWRKHD